MKYQIYPEHTKGRVNQAGKAVRKDIVSAEDDRVIENWRASHSYILNTFQATLRRHSKNTRVTIAQRLKRRPTIEDKLRRQPGMNLARMHDIAGCRLIFDSESELREFRSKIHRSRFKHKLKNELDAYNYILHPKRSGYRGIHDVYSYKSFDGSAVLWDGLLIELQYRTKFQHAWSTAVEIAGSLTGNEAKFDRGDPRHIRYFLLASCLIERHFEERRELLPDVRTFEIIQEFFELDRELGITQILKGLQISTATFRAERNLILIRDVATGKLQIVRQRSKSEALEKYSDLEKSLPEGNDVVLVSGDSNEAIRSAFRNYFQDTQEFCNLIDTIVS